MSVQRSLQVVSGSQEDSATASSGPLFRAAFASRDMERIDEHFGTATRFVIYRVTPTQATLDQVCEFDSANRDGNEDKLGPRLAALSGCHGVYCRAVGASAVRQLVRRGIYPTQLNENETIQMMIEQLQEQLADPARSPLKRGKRTKKPKGEDHFKQLLLEDEWEE
ncbi:MAG: nitrogen fixation protein NifX [Magnetococcales bacterium]|nr:nitrogen fixation protein NifX [Magnetococcales bacterium]